MHDAEVYACIYLFSVQITAFFYELNNWVLFFILTKSVYTFMICHSALLRSFEDAKKYQNIKLLVNLTRDITAIV